MSKPGLQANIELAVLRYVDMDKLTDEARTVFLQHAALDIQNFAAKAAPSDVGMLRASLSPGGDGSIMEMNAPESCRVGTKKHYGYVLEKGRRPGAAMPPVGVLLPWMHRHGIEPAMEYQIRRAIGRKGIMQYKGWFSNAVDQGLKKATDWTKAAADVLQDGWDKE